MLKRLLAVFLFAGLGASSVWCFAQKPGQSLDQERVEYLVKLKKGVGPEKLDAMFAPHEIENVTLVYGQVYKLVFKKDPGIKELQRLVKERGSLGIVEPDQKILMSNPMENERTKNK